MLNMHGTMEGFEAPEADKTNDLELNELFLTVAEESIEMVEQEAEYLELEAYLTEADGLIDRLENLTTAVEEYGISAQVMKAVDPEEELRAYAEIDSYEDLPVQPTKNAQCQAALEGIKDTIKKVWENIVNFFKKMYNFLTGFFSKLFNGVRNQKKALQGLIAKYNDVDEWDTSKFGDQKAKAFKFEEVRKGITGNSKVNVYLGKGEERLETLQSAIAASGTASFDAVSAQEKALIGDEACAKYYGMKLEEKGSGDDKEVVWKKTKLGYKRESKSLKECGVDAPAKMVTEMQAIIKELDEFAKTEKTANAVVKAYGTSSKAIEAQVKALTGMDDKAIKEKKKVINTYKSYITNFNALMKQRGTAHYGMANAAISAAKAGLKAKKKSK